MTSGIVTSKVAGLILRRGLCCNGNRQYPQRVVPISGMPFLETGAAF
jgi:hypothetical protein